MRAHTTGCFAVFSRHDGQNVTPRGRKARALLAYLISNPGTLIAKSRIVGLLWGERGDVQARSSLRQTIMELRHSVNQSREIVCCDREHIWVQADTLIEDAADESSGWEEAFEDLDGVSPEFDEWLTAERSRRSQRRNAALRSQAEELLRAGRAEESLMLIEKMEAINAHDEDALCLAMEAEFVRRHPAAIEDRYRAKAAVLLAELGVQPSADVRALRDSLIERLSAVPEHRRSEETDQEYFTRRAAEEREAGARAETAASQKIHEDLAERYEQAAIPLLKWTPDVQTLAAVAPSARLARFRRKSLIIHAAQWFKPGDHPAVVVEGAEDVSAYVDTPEGRLRVDAGDWIITGISGENYPCKPQVFEQLYTCESE